MGSRDAAILSKLLSEANIISEMLSAARFETFISDEKTKRAVCMTLINIGELVKNLSDEFKASASDIPWRAISGLRDIMAHRYQTVRMEDIWVTAQTDIPILRESLAKLI
ncbi:MAG: DUF86 domain-containing protein [Oscillospiraceae bacterium]|jgi:uncharacterized protein with HEPN domain|nr:DUF86 domain-containing protein [Oscillospiraceae bacterium]